MILIFGLLLLGALIYLVVAVSRNGNGFVSRKHPGGAMAILEERFARGEISREEFDERRKVLRS